uniref:Si:ch73-160i9.3 n=1 Tax=Cyprinus carpio TaxID=7962 RepID=A0A8C2HTW5_CYPCA
MLNFNRNTIYNFYLSLRIASITTLPLHHTVDIDAIMDIITIVLYTITIIIGITGNSLVIWVAGMRLKPNVTNIWLVNLAVADLIFCFTLVPALIKKIFYDHWPFENFFCKFSGFFKYANMFCSVFLLAVISVDRVLCIWRPVLTRERRTQNRKNMNTITFTFTHISVIYWILYSIFYNRTRTSKFLALTAVFSVKPCCMNGTYWTSSTKCHVIQWERALLGVFMCDSLQRLMLHSRQVFEPVSHDFKPRFTTFTPNCLSARNCS